jgi:hypothetical protein
LLVRLKAFGGGFDFFQRAHASNVAHRYGFCPAGELQNLARPPEGVEG